MLAVDIWFCGDVHGSLVRLVRALTAAPVRPRAVVLLGDLEPPVPLSEWLEPVHELVSQVCFIHGNHDTDSDASFRHVFHSSGASLSLHGCVHDVAGVRIAGLGGVFRSEIWYPPAAPAFATYTGFHEHWVPRTPRRQRDPLPALADLSGLPVFNQRLRKHHSSIFPGDYDSLAAEHADVLVVHEAPSCHPNGFEAIDQLASALGARLVVHGHHHDALDYRGSLAALGFQAMGVGLRGVTAGDGRRVVPGELDARYEKLREARSSESVDHRGIT
jgi:predicted phosphodiesterase